MANINSGEKNILEFSQEDFVEQGDSSLASMETKESVENLGPAPERRVSAAAEAVPAQVYHPIAPAKSDNYRRVEAILEEDLGDIYFQLPLAFQRQLKQRGEETTQKIIVLLSRPKVKITRIIGFIKDWLKLIPGVNRFFLEQTAKIKTDKIIAGIDKSRLI